MIDSFSGEYEFLSNFYPNDKRSLEHKYQALKTFVQPERAKILAALTPRGAKRLGKKATLRPDWEEKKVLLMFLLVSFKFAADPDLEAKLIATLPETLVEGNDWHDNFWGDCHCQEKPGRFGQRPACREPGKNMLGKILMKVRENLRRYRHEYEK